MATSAGRERAPVLDLAGGRDDGVLPVPAAGVEAWGALGHHQVCDDVVTPAAAVRLDDHRADGEIGPRAQRRVGCGRCVGDDLPVVRSREVLRGCARGGWTQRRQRGEGLPALARLRWGGGGGRPRRCGCRGCRRCGGAGREPGALVVRAGLRRQGGRGAGGSEGGQRDEGERGRSGPAVGVEQGGGGES